jgi:hypothetical protein
MQPAPRGKPPQISPIFISEKVTLHVLREKDGKLHLGYAGSGTFGTINLQASALLLNPRPYRDSGENKPANTSPPRETTSDLADFHQRQGHAPRFARKGREIPPGLRRMGRCEGRSAGRLRASSQEVEGWILPPGTGSPPPPRQKSRPPRDPPFFNQR